MGREWRGPGERGEYPVPMPSDFTDDLRLAHVLADDADALSEQDASTRALIAYYREHRR